MAGLVRGGVAGRLGGWGGWPGVGLDEGMVGNRMAGRVKGLLAGRGVGRASWVGAERWGGGVGRRAGRVEGWYKRSYSPKGCSFGGVKNTLRNQVG